MKSRMNFFYAIMVVILFAFLISPPIARSAEFPTKPVTLICPWPPGGSIDTLFRVYAESAKKYLGQPVIVENKPGGAGTVGPAAMAAAGKPDGYTVAQISIPVFRYQHMMKVDYDALKDFTYIIGLSAYTFGVVVKADAPWKTFDELIAYARANPGKIIYGAPGCREHPKHHHGANRLIERHQVDPCSNERHGGEHASASWRARECCRRFHRFCALRRLRGHAPACDFRRTTDQEVVHRPDLEGTGNRCRGGLPVRLGRTQGNGPGGREKTP